MGSHTKRRALLSSSAAFIHMKVRPADGSRGNLYDAVIGMLDFGHRPLLNCDLERL
jgi:hypothetical protein